MTIPAVAPYLPTYATREAYVTQAEFKAAPTGVNVSQLVPQGSPAMQSNALDEVLLRASSMADSYCHQVLAATLETVSSNWLTRGASLVLVCPQSPVIQVNSILWGPTGAQAALTDLSGVDIDDKVVTVPLSQASGSNRLRATMQYVAGYANSILTVAATAGDNTITVDSALGVVATMGLRVNDPGQDEQITVLSVTGNVLQLAAPLRFGHSVGVNVSALPASVKQAVILYATSLIKVRGGDAVVLPSMRQQPSEKTMVITPSGKQERVTAEMLLMPFVAVP